jgi:hypothetical protein
VEKKRHDPHCHGGHHHGTHRDEDRNGARQAERFDPARAALLDDPSRFWYLPPDEIFNIVDSSVFASSPVRSIPPPPPLTTYDPQIDDILLAILSA